jgi:hypothetical protein
VCLFWMTVSLRLIVLTLFRNIRPLFIHMVWGEKKTRCGGNVSQRHDTVMFGSRFRDIEILVLWAWWAFIFLVGEDGRNGERALSSGS